MAPVPVTLTFPSPAALTAFVDVMALRFGYAAVLEDGTPNPQTKGEFVRGLIIKWMKREYKEHVDNTAKAAISNPEPDIT
jgi:hypothetical protein